MSKLPCFWGKRLLPGLLLLNSGCYQLTIQSASEEPMVLNGAPILQRAPHRVIRHFYREQALDYVFGVNEKQDTIVGEILSQETGAHGGAINLKVRRILTPLDVVVSLFTLGIYCRGRVAVEGDVIVWDDTAR